MHQDFLWVSLILQCFLGDWLEDRIHKKGVLKCVTAVDGAQYVTIVSTLWFLMLTLYPVPE